MKFKEQLYFSLYALKKHKFRFAINCTVILIITVVIFILSSIISTIDKTIDNDFVNAVKNNDYILNVNLQGNYLPNGKWGVNLQEKLKVEELLNKYGELISNYKVISEIVDYTLADRTLPLKPIFIDDKFNKNIDGLNYEIADLRVGNIWLGKELAEEAAALGVELNAGDTINAKISENIYEFRIKGILENGSDVYIGLEYSLEIGLANISFIEYQIENKEFGNLKFLKSFVRNINQCDEGLDKNVNAHTKRLNGTDISGYEVNKAKSHLYLWLFCVGIAFLTTLIIGLLRNNAMIDIEDRIGFFAILRCLGLENRKIVNISLFEAVLSLTIGVIGAFLASFAFKSLIIAIADIIVSKWLLVSNSVITYSFEWWNICFLPIIALLSFLYFTFVLHRRLKRKNIMKVLKEAQQ